MSETVPQTSPESSDSEILGRGAGLLLVGKFSGRAVSFGVQILLARLLGPAALGVYALGLKILQLTGFLATLGLDQGAVRFGAAAWLRDPPRVRGLLLQTLRWTVVAGSVAAAALVAAAPWLSEAVFGSPRLAEVLPLFAVGALLLAVLRVAAAGSRTTQNMRYSVAAEDLCQPLALLVLVVAFHLAGWGLVGAAAATVLALLMGAALALYYLHRLTGLLRPGGERERVPPRELLAFSLPTALAGTLSMFVFSIDLLLVGYFLPETQTGIYQAASQIPLLFVLILTAFNNILSPMIADLYHRRELKRLAEVFKLGTKWGLYLSLPLFLLLVMDSENLMGSLFGAEFREGALPMVLLCAGQMVNLATGAVGFMLIMSGRQNWWLGLSAAALAANVALGVTLIPRLGLLGAALAAALALAGLFLTGLAMVRFGLGFWPYDRRLLKLLPATAAAALGVFLVGRLDLAPGLLRLGLTAAVAFSTFAAVLLAQGLDPEDRELAASLLRGGSRSAAGGARSGR